MAQVGKMEIDFSSAVDSKLPEAEKLAKDGKLDEAIESLLSMERQTRTASDTHSTTRLLVAIVRLCHEFKQWDKLNENIVLLSKRRGQICQSIQAMVQEVIGALDKAPTMETRLSVINTLRTVTEGKIYVEVERARMTYALSKILESQGDIEQAAKVLLELQIETFGSMERKEKVEMLLEQMRLCLARSDFIRTQIISKKVSVKVFEQDAREMRFLKKKFYDQMIELDEHNSDYLAIAKHYLALYNTPLLMEEDIYNDGSQQQRKLWTLKNIVAYLLLAPYDNEQSDMVHRVKSDRNLEELPMYKELLSWFTCEELINWTQLGQQFEAELRRGDGKWRLNAFATGDERGEQRWRHLRDRALEHNLRVVAKFYTRIGMPRLAQLLDMSTQEAEDLVSKLVVNGTIVAKMDRLAGVAHFYASANHQPSANDVLNEWSSNIAHLMQLINKSTHLITKEQMVHRFGAGAKALAPAAGAPSS